MNAHDNAVREDREGPIRLHVPMVLYLTGLAAAATAPAVVEVVADLGPPAHGITPRQVTLFSLIIALVGYVFAARLTAPLDRDARRGRLLILGATLVAAVLAYTGLWQFLVLEMPDRAHRVIVGFAYSPAAAEIRADNPGIRDADLVREYFGRQYWLAYTEPGLAAANWSMLLAWFGFFASLSAFIAVVCLPSPTNPPGQPLPADEPRKGSAGDAATSRTAPPATASE